MMMMTTIITIINYSAEHREHAQRFSVHRNLMVPPLCITPPDIGAPHSLQAIICPSFGGDAILILYYFEIMLCEIKIRPISFEAAEAKRRLRDEGLLSNTKR